LADRITTVSPTYAAEIRTPEDGMGLDGLLRKRAGVLTGIRNGIDDVVWNPATDPHLAARFDARRIARRSLNKTALQAGFRLERDPAAFVLGVISRLTSQKGMDLLLDALPAVTASGAQLALIGSGDKPLEHRFAPPRRVIPVASARSSAMTSRSRISSRAAPTRCSFRRASSPAASPSCARCATAPSLSWPASAALPIPSSTPTRWPSRLELRPAFSSRQ
jgi:glycogen synthase